MMAVEGALSFLWRHWRIVGWALSVAAMGIALMLAHANARHFKKLFENREQIIREMKLAAAEQEAANKARIADAAKEYADRAAALQPIIVRSKETVHAYAQTPAGRAVCLDAGRVRDIEAFDSALNDPPASGRSAGAVPDTGAK